MKQSMRRRISSGSRGATSLCSFLGGFIVCMFLFQSSSPSTPTPLSSTLQPSLARLPAPDKIPNAWRHSPETCPQWIHIQRASASYLDAYVVGSQKGATSQLSKHLYDLGVRHQTMVKEWHFFNQLDETGQLVRARTVARPLPPITDIPQIRLLHYLTGFPDSNVTASSIPLVDDRPLTHRLLTLDMTVEYLHSDRSAFLAQTLTPHAKIIITIRDPLDRALSQYNMNIRNGNKKRRKLHRPEIPATPIEFDKKVRMEIAKLHKCGYDPDTATLNRRTSELVACLFHHSARDKFDESLYVLRGLYHLHIQTWLDYFPSHRVHIISFHDVSLGKRQMYNDLTDFLCIRRYPEPFLSKFEADGNSLSFGQQAAEKGLRAAGFDTYDGNDRYLPSMLDTTRLVLKQFYAPADQRLKDMLGEHYVYWAS